MPGADGQPLMAMYRSAWGAQHLEINAFVTGSGMNTRRLASEDRLDIDSADRLELNASNGPINIGNDADAQNINVGTSASARVITIGNDASTKADINALAIELDSGPGGIELNSSGGDVDIASGGGNVKLTGNQVRLTSQGDTADAISLRTSGGASETISLTNTMGTGEDAISITSAAGGIDIDAGATKDVNIAGGQIVLNSKDNSAQAISLRTNVGMSQGLRIT